MNWNGSEKVELTMHLNHRILSTGRDPKKTDVV